MKMLYANRVILDPLYSVIALVVGTVALGTLAASRYIKGREDYDPIDDEGIPLKPLYRVLHVVNIMFEIILWGILFALVWFGVYFAMKHW